MNRSVRLLAAVLAPLLAVAVACGDDDDTATVVDEVTTTQAPADDVGGDDDAPADGETAAEITIEGAWARSSPMMATRGAVYMQITASADDRLVAARVSDDVAASTEVHETVRDPDTREMSMRETDAIDLPAGETVFLEPGGYHIMLLDLVEPLEPGTTLEVILEFDVAGEVRVEAEVREATPGMGMDG
jgi:periplasmic copper chaperone A